MCSPLTRKEKTIFFNLDSFYVFLATDTLNIFSLHADINSDYEDVERGNRSRAVILIEPYART
jgi:hypothetical protein